jgi:hypothetical protein
MVRKDRRGTVRAMSIRAAISDLLTGGGMRSDPAAALEEAGYEGVSAEEFGTALTHFAETATLAEADALAPVVTRTGPIPLTDDDLPEIAAIGGAEDSFSLFSQTVTEVHQDYGESGLDTLDDIDGEPELEPVVDHSEGTGTPDEVDLRFGEPSSEDQPLETSFGESSLDDVSLDDVSLDDVPLDDAPLEQLDPVSVFDDLDLDDASTSEEAPESTDAATSAPESDGSSDTFDNDLDFDI